MLRNLILLLLVAEGLCVPFQRVPTVKSPAGKFRGKVLTAQNGRLYNSFRGIPYAKPPVGDLRFAKPQPLPRLQGTFDARDYGPICVQPFGRPDRGQEDCLTLNVFTPRPRRIRQKCRRRRSLKPVLFFIQGGGAIQGSSKDYGLPGNLVTRGDIVVVTVNYRLGWLGFLRGNTDKLPGNQGLWDILLALNWTKDNIETFGGDPDDVTLGGHSAGGNLATFLSMSPLTKGLYNKVVLLSGGYIEFSFLPRTSNDLLTLGASRFGCNDSLSGQPGQSLDEDRVTECLKNVEALDFGNVRIRITGLFIASGDAIFPRSPAQALTDPTYLTNVGFFSRSYLMGVTKNDGYVYVDSNLVSPDISTPERTVTYLANFFGLPVSGAQNILGPYRNLNGGNDERSLTAFFTDFTIQQYIDIFMALNTTQERGDGFMMSFDHEPSYIRDGLVPHGLDLVYLFDISPQELLEVFYNNLSASGPLTRTDRILGRSYIDLVTDFIKTGDPGITLSRKFDLEWIPGHPVIKPYLSFSTCPFLGQNLRGRLLAGGGGILPG